MRRDRILLGMAVVAILGGVCGCGTQRKARDLQERNLSAHLQLPKQNDFLPEFTDVSVKRRDTLKVTDLEGNEFIVMKAIRDDETGDMVAAEMLDAAYVTARFRNLAERNGKIDLEFQVVVPQEMQDSRWQCRFHPDMFILQDSIRLDDVVITGEEYRRAQLRGYQQYERFLSSIINDSTKLIDMRNFLIFLERNIPQVYALRNDSTYVSDEQFESLFGVSEREALDHYSRKFLIKRNNRRRAKQARMYAKYVKAPILVEGIRLDTVIRGVNGDFIYNYIQTINTRPKLRKVDVVLSGEIYEQEKRVYTVPRGDTLTFYISSVSAFVDNTEKYMTKVISRNVAASTYCNIDFKAGKADIDEKMGDNAREIGYIRQNLRDLLLNETLDLDSVTIAATASPEGSVASNNSLAMRRSRAAVEYFESYVNFVRDSIRREEGMFITIADDFSESSMRTTRRASRDIRFKARSGGEDWETLTDYIRKDTVLTDEQKARYDELLLVSNLDNREKQMRSESWGKYVVDTYYPKLRTVRFRFALHRKGMVKDTIHTTELDTVYMKGVQAIRDHDYQAAIAFLSPYADYNTAVAYVALDRNANAYEILKDMERTPQVNYMLALIYARRGDDQNAVQHYLNACQQDRSYVSRGNLDPEIAALIKKYDLNKEPDDDDWGDLVY